jgi:hypothetical protein
MGNCGYFKSRIADWLDTGMDPQVAPSLESHRLSCAACARLLEQCTASLALLRMAREQAISVPAELDRRVLSGVDPSADFVRLMMRHVDPLPAPAQLDERVLSPATMGRGVVAIETIRRHRIQRWIVLAVAASVVVTVGAIALYNSGATRQGGLRSPIRFIEVSSSEAPLFIQGMAGSLSGDVAAFRKV